MAKEHETRSARALFGALTKRDVLFRGTYSRGILSSGCVAALHHRADVLGRYPQKIIKDTFFLRPHS